jgi:predicted DNA-binding mobile mystery protein A
VRTAIGLTQGEVAAKIGVKRQSLAQFETAEERGSISIASMRRAAEAMDCELIYFIVPRETIARSYVELAQRNDPASVHLRATDQSMALKRQDGAEDAD